jgi:TPR repeat protein
MRLSLFVLIVGFASIVAASAQESAPSVMKQCGDKWQAAKAAGTTGDVTWTQFLSGCRAEIAAQPASAATAPVPAAAPTNQQLGTVAASPAAPSFDCATAKSGAARLICSDAELSKADADLGKAFHASFARLEGTDKSAAIKDQVQWIRARNTRCGLNGKENASIEELAGAKGCILQAMQSRIQYFGSANVTASSASPTTAPPSAPVPAVTPKALEDGSAALQQKDYPTALRLLQPLADQGNPKAQVLVGRMYFLGWGVPKDEAEAVKWIHESADQGNPDGQKYLAFMYFSGNGMTKDITEAIKWFRKAADQGDVAAQSMLGGIYGSGSSGVPRDDAEAIKWYRKAADQGDALSKAFLAQLLASNGAAPIPGIDFGPRTQGTNSDEQTMFAQIQEFRVESTGGPGPCNFIAGAWDGSVPAPLATVAAVQIRANLDERLRKILLDDDKTIRLLDYMRIRSIQYCKQQGINTLPPVFVVHLRGGYVENGVYPELGAYSNGERDRWNIFNNSLTESTKHYLVMEAAQQEAQRKYALQQQIISQQKQAIREKFQSDFNVQQYPSMGDLASNPFRFKGSVVAVPTNFAKMMSEGDAIFSDNRRIELFVSGVPSTLFRGGEEVVLALRVAGTTAVKTPAGEVNLPSGEFVGVYKCLQDGCSEYFN